MNLDLSDQVDFWDTNYFMKKIQIDDLLIYKIIGFAMKAHAYLGNGFQEVIYQRALAIELRKAGISFVREFEIHIHYQER